MRDGTLQRRPGVTPGFISGPTPGNASAWDTVVQGVQRIEAVSDAIQVGRERAGAAILDETGHALEEVVKGLIPGLLMMLVTLVATTVIGGAIGAAVGVLAGGVGAVPGAAIGADLGLSAGMSILTWLGLGFLAVSIAQGFGEMIGAISVATTRAWEAPDSPRPRGEIELAGDEYAHAIALLFKFILMAIVLRLAGPASEALIAQLRKSRLGEGFANWVIANREALLKNPKLRPRPKAQQSEAPVRDAQSPSQVKKQADKAEAAEEAAKPGMQRKDVKCFKKNDKGNPAEYDRQLADQEKGLNDLSVKEYMEGRARYSDIGREGTGAAQKAAREKYSKELQAQFEKQLGEDGVFGDEATKKAAGMTAERMKTLAALHNPDMIAGGKDVVTSMGDKGVNSSIGSQWKNGVDEQGRTRVQALDEAAKTVPESARGSTKMNATLRRCK